MIDYVESHLRKELGPTIAYRYPVCEAILVVLDTIDVFKLHVKKRIVLPSEIYSICAREEEAGLYKLYISGNAEL